MKTTLHLISDSTGGTLIANSDAVAAQFSSVKVKRYVWSMVRDKRKIDHICSVMKDDNSFVMCTIANPELREYLSVKCTEMDVTCVKFLSYAIEKFAKHVEMKPNFVPGIQHSSDESYMDKIAAIEYTLAHDDGRGMYDIQDADIVLLGVSRSSKTPTSIYLAYRGYKVANIPLVPGIDLDHIAQSVNTKFAIGLVIDKDRLINLRKFRLMEMGDDHNENYIDSVAVSEELLHARRLFMRHKFQSIDVTCRSVEEISSNIINLYNKFHS